MNQNSWLSAVTTCIYLSDRLIPFADGLTAFSRSSGITTYTANNTIEVEDYNFSWYTLELFSSPQFCRHLCIHSLHKRNTITSLWRHCLTNLYDFLFLLFLKDSLTRVKFVLNYFRLPTARLRPFFFRTESCRSC